MTERSACTTWRAPVDLVADVVGYYTDHDHDDRYLTTADVPLRFTAKRTVALSQWAYAVLGGALELDGRSDCRMLPEAGVLSVSLPLPADVALESVAVTVDDASTDGTVQVELIATPQWGPSMTIDSFTTGLADAAGVRTIELGAPGVDVQTGTTYMVRATVSDHPQEHVAVCRTSFTFG